jgi:GT2 family glycosyltransferase
MLTIILISFHSEDLINNFLKRINNKFPVIIIENSLNYKLKKIIKKKYKNTKIIIPQKNIGIPKALNLGIKKSKTKYIFITSPDVIIYANTIKKLLKLANKNKNFSLLAPSYKNKKKYTNYQIFSQKDKKNKVIEVDWIDNNFILNKTEFTKKIFDENIFMYYETHDLCKQISRFQKKMYVSKDLKFIHLNSSSTNNKFSFLYKINRNWHYNFSKFYYFKKHYGRLFALKKIFPNIIRSIKSIIKYRIYNDIINYELSKAELLGIIYSVFEMSPSFRPFELIKFQKMNYLKNYE